MIYCDSGHNEDGICKIIAQLEKMEHRQPHFVFGMVNDKSGDKILALFPKNGIYYLARPDIPRGLDVAELELSIESITLQPKLKVQSEKNPRIFHANPFVLYFQSI